MNVTNKKGPIFESGLCRCCGAIKKCRLLNVEYEWRGQKEVYCDMFIENLGLMLSHLDGTESERLICATCVVRLRDATAFRRQVISCEERMLNTWMTEGGSKDPSILLEIKEEVVEQSDPVLANDRVSASLCDRDNDSQHNEIADNDYDSDDIPISEVLVKRKVEPSTNSPRKLKKPKIKKTKVRLKDERELRDKVARDKETKSRRQEIRQKTEYNKRSIQNTITIIENSYVCPFDTSFSDYYCFYCREIFTDPNKLREHTQNHDPTTFKDVLQSNYTKKTRQIDITRIDCRLCSENIKDIEKFKIHITEIHKKTIHKVENEFLKFKLTETNLTCLECDAVFSFFHALKKHMAEHFGSCTCDTCGSHYFEERMLLLHKKTHEKVDASFPCRDCEKSFKTSHSRTLHESKVHRKEPSFQCPKCDLVFFSYNLRYRHLIESHGEQRVFRCAECDKSYDSRRSLREHTRRVHARVLLHQCELCDRRFYLPSRLREHMSTHTGERNYRCEYCGKSYPRLRGLKVHMQSHTRDKKYKCHLCQASFTQNINLKNHVKRQHQNDEFNVAVENSLMR